MTVLRQRVVIRYEIVDRLRDIHTLVTLPIKRRRDVMTEPATLLFAYIYVGLAWPCPLLVHCLLVVYSNLHIHLCGACDSCTIYYCVSLF